MHIRVEKAADGTYIVEVPAKKKKDKKGMEMCNEDLKYTTKTEEECIKVIKEALKEIDAPNDEYGIAFNEAVKEPKG